MWSSIYRWPTTHRLGITDRSPQMAAGASCRTPCPWLSVPCWAGQAGPVPPIPFWSPEVRCTYLGLCQECSFLFWLTSPPCSCLLREALSDSFSFWLVPSCLSNLESGPHPPQGVDLRGHCRPTANGKTEKCSLMSFPKGRADVLSAPSEELGKGAPGREAKGWGKCQSGLVSPVRIGGFCQAWSLHSGTAFWTNEYKNKKRWLVQGCPRESN